jgi:hypothetical protein
VAVVLALIGLALIVVGGWRGSPVAGGTPPVSTTTLIVAARALEAGSGVASSDVTTVSVPAAGALTALAHSTAEVVGRHLLLPVPSGTPLQASVLTAAPPLASDHRLVRVSLDTSSLAADVVAGVDVDVLAAVSSTDAADGGGRVVTVATARLVGFSVSSSSTTLTLDCDAAGASRVLWAQTFAKAMRVLAHPSGGAVPPSDVGGLAASRSG